MTSKIRPNPSSKASKNHPKYSAKKELFVEAYIGPANFNATEAGRLTGYAASSVQKLMEDGWVKQRIEKALAETVKQYKLEKELAIRRLYCVLTADPIMVFNQGVDGALTVKAFSEMDPEVRQCIQDIDYTKKVWGYTEEGEEQYEIKIRIRWQSKDKALELVMKHLGMFKDDSGEGAKVGVDMRSLTIQMIQEYREKPTIVVDMAAHKTRLLEERKNNE